LLKIGAHIRVTVRKVWVSLASGHPYAELFTGCGSHSGQIAVNVLKTDCQELT
jgi:hypothetical protein